MKILIVHDEIEFKNNGLVKYSVLPRHRNKYTL